MNDELEKSSTTDGLPVAPSLGPALQLARVPTRSNPVDARLVFISAISIVIGAAAGGMALLLIRLIWLFTNISFFGTFSVQRVVAADNHLGPWVILIPVMGGVLVGLILRFGSRAVAGHGIPEAMEQVLLNQSRVPPRMMFLKPFSAALAIGTGGPFGVEGPIIATGGAMGSVVGQWLATTASERKVLLAAGAAGGIAAAFGSPIAAVLLAIELLLFEFRPRSIIPVALASAAATAIHMHVEHGAAFFPFVGPPVDPAGGAQLFSFLLLGALVGIGAVVMTRTVYHLEHLFQYLPIHWMWHPALGGLAVGIIGWILPRTLGPGYFNVFDLLSGTPATGKLALAAVAALLILKLASWSIALGSGTSGGTLVPVFTIGGALCLLLAAGLNRLIPQIGVDVRLAALVGMVAIFAGSSRALLTSVVFAYETTLEPHAVLPALVGCCSAYVVSALIMRHSIMTEKMARQGVRVPVEFVADFLDQILVGDVATREVVCLSGGQRVDDVRRWMDSGQPGSDHQGFPVVDEAENLIGVLTRRDLANPAATPQATVGELIRRPPVLVYSDCTLLDAADHMVNHNIGRLPVIDRDRRRVVGIITRSDLLVAHRRRQRDSELTQPTLRFFNRWRRPVTNGLKSI